ncbi:MAG: hypothetical protein ACLGGX_08405 [Bdellovibrionia bacterium]
MNAIIWKRNLFSIRKTCGQLILHAVILTSLSACKIGGDLANESVSGEKIEDGSLSGEKLTDGTVTPAKLDRSYETSVTAGTTTQYYRGDKTWQTLNTSVVTEGTNLYYTDTRARASISGTSPVSYNSSTGAISLGTVGVANGGTGLTALGTANQLLGVNSGATAAEYKTLNGTTNQLNVTHAAGAITLSTPQDIHSGASPTFAGLTLTGFSGFVRATSGALSASALSSSDVTTALGYTPVNKAGDTMTGTLNLPSNGLVVGTTELSVSGSSVGVGIASPSQKLDVVIDDAATNTVTTVARFAHSTTGTAAAGFGAALLLGGERSDATLGSLGSIQALWSDATTGAEDSDIDFRPVLNGALSTVLRLRSTGVVGIGTIDPRSTLQVNGSFATVFSSKTAAYTLNIGDSVIATDASGAAFAVTLPTAVGITGREYTIKKIDNSANAVTVTPSGTETIDGAASYSLGAQWKYVKMISDGANWLVIGNN